ncbi:MAG TPA: carboxypeptidase-like regulatory domain-containing protein [Terriglobales bacterium]|nr:carboxypeptidase-like regulatory domain-containing protein [Terriglobales bacterium]
MKLRPLLAIAMLIALAVPATVVAKDKDDRPASSVNFTVLKDESGKPIRNAAVVLHPVDKHGKPQRNGFELKTDAEGNTHFDGVPYGPLNIQVIAPGFQTFGDNFKIGQPEQQFTIRLKRPQGQYSIYEKHDKSESSPAPR